jgi:hypothetical protein
MFFLLSIGTNGSLIFCLSGLIRMTKKHRASLRRPSGQRALLLDVIFRQVVRSTWAGDADCAEQSHRSGNDSSVESDLTR